MPRHSSFAWVALHGRFKTRDEFKQICILCGGANESEGHPFQECQLASIIWHGHLLKMGYLRAISATWEEEVNWGVERFSSSDLSSIKKLDFAGFIYQGWRERNK